VICVDPEESMASTMCGLGTAVPVAILLCILGLLKVKISWGVEQGGEAGGGEKGVHPAFCIGDDCSRLEVPSCM
jgi:hypothetical protein